MIPCFEDLTQKTFCGLHFGNDWSNSLSVQQLVGYDLLGTALLVGSILGPLLFFTWRQNKKHLNTSSRTSSEESK